MFINVKDLENPLHYYIDLFLNENRTFTMKEAIEFCAMVLGNSSNPMFNSCSDKNLGVFIERDLKDFLRKSPRVSESKGIFYVIGPKPLRQGKTDKRRVLQLVKDIHNNGYPFVTSSLLFNSSVRMFPAWEKGIFSDTLSKLKSDGHVNSYRIKGGRRELAWRATAYMKDINQGIPVGEQIPLFSPETESDENTLPQKLRYRFQSESDNGFDLVVQKNFDLSIEGRGIFEGISLSVSSKNLVDQNKK